MTEAAGGQISKHRLSEVFGEVLPESTKDDLVESEDRNSSSHDSWLRENIPPHH